MERSKTCGGTAGQLGGARRAGKGFVRSGSIYSIKFVSELEGVIKLWRNE